MVVVKNSIKNLLVKIHNEIQNSMYLKSITKLEKSFEKGLQTNKKKH